MGNRPAMPAKSRVRHGHRRMVVERTPGPFQSMQGCNRQQWLPQAPSSKSCTTTDGELYESVYCFSAAWLVTLFEFSAFAFPRPRADYCVLHDRITSTH